MRVYDSSVNGDARLEECMMNTGKRARAVVTGGLACLMALGVGAPAALAFADQPSAAPLEAGDRSATMMSVLFRLVVVDEDGHSLDSPQPTGLYAKIAEGETFNGACSGQIAGLRDFARRYASESGGSFAGIRNVFFVSATNGVASVVMCEEVDLDAPVRYVPGENILELRAIVSVPGCSHGLDARGTVVTSKDRAIDVPVYDAESGSMAAGITARAVLSGANVPRGSRVFLSTVPVGGGNIEDGGDRFGIGFHLFVDGVYVHRDFGCIELMTPLLYSGVPDGLVHDAVVEACGPGMVPIERKVIPTIWDSSATVSIGISEMPDTGIIVSSYPGPVSKRFWDVTSATPHAHDIVWMARESISTGFSDGSFKPYGKVARADMAQFLYRLAGEPEFEPGAQDRATFADVDAGTPHAKAIWWLAATGISTGWSEADGSRTFRPFDLVVRQDMAAFLHRLSTWSKGSGAALPAAYAGFSDVTAQADHAQDIAWLASSKVSEGWLLPDGRREFRGMEEVARCDMAAFLRRMDRYGLVG